MFNFGGISKTAVRILGRTSLFLRTHKSEIFTIVGIVSGTAGTVAACAATLKVEPIVDNAKQEIANIHESHEVLPDKYPEEQYRKDLTVTYARTAMSVAKLYAIPVALGCLSIGCIWGGHHILRKENAAISAAYMALSESFQQYRKKVEQEFGKDKDLEYMTGLKKQTTITTDEDGNVLEESEEMVAVAPGVSMYARYFYQGEGIDRNKFYKDNPKYNLMFLRDQQNWANNRLHSRGHLMLNEVYEALGLPENQAGCIVGWLDGHGDDVVDFRITNVKFGDVLPVNGLYPTFLLDFNVDGIIDDLINNKKFKEKMNSEDYVSYKRRMVGKSLASDPEFFKKRYADKINN